MAEPLIGVQELFARRDDGALRICDTRWYLTDHEAGPAAYREAHLPGAVYTHLEHHLSAPAGPGRHPLPERATTAAALGGLGIGDEHLVVAYDDRGGAIAARLWWMLRDLGHQRVRVLDGGIAAWQAAGFPLTADVLLYPPARLSIAPGRRRIIDRTELAARLGSLPLLDARAPERYRGDVEPVDAVAGHIPTARNAPYEDNLGPDGTLLARDVLAARYRELGAADPNTVVYCGSGVTACHDILAIVAAGLPEPTLYPGSWSDWGATGMPIATGDDPATW